MNVKDYSDIDPRKKSNDEKNSNDKNENYNLQEENMDIEIDPSNMKHDQATLETQANDIQEDLLNYKGQYYNEEKEEKYYEGGAHFQYHDLYYKLEKIVKKSKNKKEKINEKSESEKTKLLQKENTNLTGLLEINNYDLISTSTISKEALLKLNLQHNLLNLQHTKNTQNGPNVKSNHTAIKSFRDGNKNLNTISSSNNINNSGNQISSGVLLTNIANSYNPVQIGVLSEVSQTKNPIFKKINPNLTLKNIQSNNKSPQKEEIKKQYIFKNRNAQGDVLEKKLNNTKVQNSNLLNRSNQSTTLIKSPSVNLFTNKVLMKLNVTNVSNTSKIVKTQEKSQLIRNNILNPSIVVNKFSNLNPGNKKKVQINNKELTVTGSPVSKTTHIINELNKISNGTLPKSRNFNLSRPKILTDNYTKNSKNSNFTKINNGTNLHSNRVKNSNIGQALLNSYNLNFNTLENKSRSRNTFRNRNIIEESSHTTSDNKTFYLKTNDSHQSLSGSHKFLSSTMRIEPNMTILNNHGISNLPLTNGQVPLNVTNVTNLNMNVNVNNIILKDSGFDYDSKQIENDQFNKNSSNKINISDKASKDHSNKHMNSNSILNNLNEKLTNVINNHLSSTMKNNLTKNLVRSSSDLLQNNKKLTFNSNTGYSKGNILLSHRENNNPMNSILNSPVQKLHVNLNLQNFSNAKNISGNLININSSSNTSNTYTNSNTNNTQNRSLSKRVDRRVLLSRKDIYLIIHF
jgi:hypothetical protein